MLHCVQPGAQNHRTTGRSPASGFVESLTNNVEGSTVALPPTVVVTSTAAERLVPEPHAETHRTTAHMVTTPSRIREVMLER